MDLLFSGGEEERRRVRRWLEENPDASRRAIGEAGYAVPHWPKPWGLEASPQEQLVIEEEFDRAGIDRTWALMSYLGEPLLVHGTSQQQERYLLPMITGEEVWCQLFSEPEAGSDLAALRTTAIRDGDAYVLNGQKTWTSMAEYAQFGLLLARTDPSAAKHRGISLFVCPMSLSGVTVRGIRDLSGNHRFNEVFFDGVRLDVSQLIGAENEGWRVAKAVLARERVSLSGQGGWVGPTAYALIELVRGHGDELDPVTRDDLTRLYIEAELLRMLRLRTVSASLRGVEAGPEASIRKLFSDRHGQRIMEVAKDLAGARGMLADGGPCGTGGSQPWAQGFLTSRSFTIGGGTTEVQRNIIAERVLGLPADPHR